MQLQLWLSSYEKAENLVLIQSMGLAASVSLQSTLESWLSRFRHQERIATVAGQVNLPARVRTSKQRTKAPFLLIFLCGLPLEGVAQI